MIMAILTLILPLIARLSLNSNDFEIIMTVNEGKNLIFEMFLFQVN